MSWLQLRTIITKEGLSQGLYSGYGAFMLRDLPFDAVEFVTYEQVGGLASMLGTTAFSVTTRYLILGVQIILKD